MSAKDSVVLEGRHGAPGVAVWALPALGGLSFLLALALWEEGDASAATILAWLSAVPMALFALTWLGVGKVRLTEPSLEGTRLLGSRFRMEWEGLSATARPGGTLRCRSKDGLSIVLKNLLPELRDVAWLKCRLPAVRVATLRDELARGPSARGSFPARRELLDEQARPFFADTGTLVTLGERHLYLPHTATLCVAGLDAVSGQAKELVLHQGQPPEALDVGSVVGAVQRLALDDAARLALLEALVAVLGGSVFTGAFDAEGLLWGEAAGRRVRLERSQRRSEAPDAHSAQLSSRLNATRAATTIGVSIGALVLAVALAILGVGIADQLPVRMQQLMFLTAVVAFSIGIYGLTSVGRHSRTAGCASCRVALKRAEAGFFLETEAALLGAIALGDAAGLRGLQPLPPGDLSIIVTLDYCPKCRAVGQVAVSRRQGVVEPLLSGKQALSGTFVGELAEHLTTTA